MAGNAPARFPLSAPPMSKPAHVFRVTAPIFRPVRALPGDLVIVDPDPAVGIAVLRPSAAATPENVLELLQAAAEGVLVALPAAECRAERAG